MCRITADAPRSCSLEGCALWVSLEIHPPHSYQWSGFQEKKIWPSHSSPLKLVMVPMHVRIKSQEFSWQAESSLTGLCLTAVFSHIVGTITSICVVIRSKVVQSCPTVCNPMDCSLPGSSVHGIFQARVLEWAAISSPGDLPDQELNLGLPHCRQMLYHLSHQGSPEKDYHLCSIYLSVYLSGFKWIMAIFFLVWLLIPIFVHIILLWALSLLRQSASSFKILLVSV